MIIPISQPFFFIPFYVVIGKMIRSPKSQKSSIWIKKSKYLFAVYPVKCRVSIILYWRNIWLAHNISRTIYWVLIRVSMQLEEILQNVFLYHIRSLPIFFLYTLLVLFWNNNCYIYQPTKIICIAYALIHLIVLVLHIIKNPQEIILILEKTFIK